MEEHACYQPSLEIEIHSFVEQGAKQPEFPLRQLTPGFDETTQTNRAIINMLGRENSVRSSGFVEDSTDLNLDLDTVVPMTIDPDTSLYAKSIHKVNCTPIGRSSVVHSHRQNLNEDQYETRVPLDKSIRKVELLTPENLSQSGSQLFATSRVETIKTKWVPRQMETAKKRSDAEEVDDIDAEDFDD